jgi:hypothetical protein
MASNAGRSLRVDPRKWVVEVRKNLVCVGRSVAVRSERVLVMGLRDGVGTGKSDLVHHKIGQARLLRLSPSCSQASIQEKQLSKKL